MSITHKNIFCNRPYSDLNYLLGIYNHAYIEIGFTIDIYSTDKVFIKTGMSYNTLCDFLFAHNQKNSD